MISPLNNSNTPPELAYVQVSTPDAGSALVDVVHVYNLRGRFTRTYPFGTRWMLPSTSYSQARILTFVTNPRKPLTLFETLASERVSSGTTTNALIFIAHDSRAQIVSQELHLANGVPTAKRASFESILDVTYGVVFVRSRRHRRQRLARALILAAGHLACYIMLRNYENIHGARTETMCRILTSIHGYIKGYYQGGQDIRAIISRRDLQSCWKRCVQPGKSCRL
jgi:hypothetical protein